MCYHWSVAHLCRKGSQCNKILIPLNWVSSLTSWACHNIWGRQCRKSHAETKHAVHSEDSIWTSHFFMVILRPARVSFPHVFLQTVTCRWQHTTKRIWSSVEVSWVIYNRTESDLNDLKIILNVDECSIWSLAFSIFELWEHDCWGPKAECALSGHPPSVANAHREKWSFYSLSSLSLKEFAWLSYPYKLAPSNFGACYAKEVKEKQW